MCSFRHGTRTEFMAMVRYLERGGKKRWRDKSGVKLFNVKAWYKMQTKINVS